MSLTDKLNKGFRLPFQNYTKPIPITVPALRAEERIFAGGNIVLGNRVDALTPNEQGETDQESIDRWGQYFNLADLCVTFGEFVMLQPDSGFLTGIRGIVEKDGQTYIAVDADAVKAAIADGAERYFQKQVSISETVHYPSRDRTKKQEQVNNVVLFPYNGRFFELDADQSNAITGKKIKRDQVIYGRDMAPGEIIEGNRVIHPAWAIYYAETVVSLVQRMEKFRFEGRDYNFDEVMGFYLPSVPSGNAGEARALCVLRLYGRSRLCAGIGLGVGNFRVVGVDKKYAESVAKK